MIIVMKVFEDGETFIVVAVDGDGFITEVLASNNVRDPPPLGSDHPIFGWNKEE